MILIFSVHFFSFEKQGTEMILRCSSTEFLLWSNDKKKYRLLIVGTKKSKIFVVFLSHCFLNRLKQIYNKTNNYFICKLVLFHSFQALAGPGLLNTTFFQR